MENQLIMMLLVLASGFVAAGLLNAFHRYAVWVDTDEPERPMVLYFDTLPATLWSILICTFAGPYLVLANGIYFWRLNVLPPYGLAVCGILSLVWSFCSGVFIVEVTLALLRL